MITIILYMLGAFITAVLARERLAWSTGNWAVLLSALGWPVVALLGLLITVWDWLTDRATY